MSQSESALEGQRGGYSNVREDKPTLLPSLFTAENHPSLTNSPYFDREPEPQSSKSLRIQLFLNPSQRPNGSPPTSQHDTEMVQSIPTADSPAPPISTQPMRVLPSIHDLSGNQSENQGNNSLESPNHSVSSPPPSVLDFNKQTHYSAASPSQLSAGRKSDYFSTHYTGLSSQRRPSDPMITPPAQSINGQIASGAYPTPTSSRYGSQQSLSYGDPHGMEDTHPILSTVKSDPEYGMTPPSVAHRSHQLKSMSNPNGPFQVPVDMKAASKEADEKRKRNAGASARFRQRRKQREVEDRDRIKELSAEVEHYKKECQELRMACAFLERERDHFTSLISNGRLVCGMN